MEGRGRHDNPFRHGNRKIIHSGCEPQAERLVEILSEKSYKTPAPEEKLPGDPTGAYSRRIIIQQRLNYRIPDMIMRLGTPYE